MNFLEKNESIKWLKLTKNLLKSINLSPLSNCKNLNELDLSENLIEEIDISPLLKCMNLKFFFIDHKTKLIWDKLIPIPNKDELPLGLRRYYDRIIKSI